MCQIYSYSIINNGLYVKAIVCPTSCGKSLPVELLRVKKEEVVKKNNWEEAVLKPARLAGFRWFFFLKSGHPSQFGTGTGSP